MHRYIYTNCFSLSTYLPTRSHLYTTPRIPHRSFHRKRYGLSAQINRPFVFIYYFTNKHSNHELFERKTLSKDAVNRSPRRFSTKNSPPLQRIQKQARVMPRTKYVLLRTEILNARNRSLPNKRRHV